MAASSIVIFHLGLANLHSSLIDAGHPYAGRFMGGAGSSGVELFFTLSAVVLLRPYLRSSRPMDVAKYFWRRCTRLWPPFVGAWILAGAVVELISRYPTWWPSEMPAFSFSDWGAQLFIFYIGHHAYNFAWWTLTIEIIFYALAPLLVAVLAKRSATTMTIAFMSSIPIALIAGRYTSANGIYDILLKFVSFGSCFFGGLLLAKQDISAKARICLVAAGIAVVAASIVGTHMDDCRAGYGLLYMALVSHVSMPDTPAGQMLSRPLLVWLGERSYSLFLTHFSVIALACWTTSFFVGSKDLPYFVVSRALALMGSLIVSCVLFETVERRFAHGLVTGGMWLPGTRLGTVTTART